MASLGKEGFETGTNGANLTTATLTSLTVPTPSTKAIFSTDHPNSGSLGALFNCAAANSSIYQSISSVASVWTRWYGYFTALPAAATYVQSFQLAGVKLADVRINADGSVTARNQATIAVAGPSTTLLTANSRFRLECKVTGASEIRVRLFVGANVDGVTADQEIVGVLGAGNTDKCVVGIIAASTWALYVDDWETNDAAFVGPLTVPGVSQNISFTGQVYDLRVPSLVIATSATVKWTAPTYYLQVNPWTAKGDQFLNVVDANVAWPSRSIYVQMSPNITATGNVVFDPPPPIDPLPPGIIAGGQYAVVFNPPNFGVTVTSGAAMKRNDLEPDFVATVYDKDSGKAVDLTLATSARLILTNLDSGAVKVTNGQMLFTDRPNGILTYQWNLGDTDTAGRYVGEVEVTWPSARPQTFPTVGTLSVIVSADLG